MKRFLVLLVLLFAVPAAMAQKLAVRKNGTRNMHYVVIDDNGKAVKPVLKYYSEGPQPLGGIGKIYYVDKRSGKKIYGFKSNSNIVVPCRYVHIDLLQLSGSYIAAMPDGKYGLLDKNGKEVLQPLYDSIGRYNNEDIWLILKRDGKYGIADYRGTVCLPLLYDRIYPWRSSAAPGGIVIFDVMKDGKWGCIDQKNNVVVPLRYGEHIYVDGKIGNSDFAMVVMGGKEGVIDFVTGGTIVPIEYVSVGFTNASLMHNGVAFSTQKKFGGPSEEFYDHVGNRFATKAAAVASVKSQLSPEGGSVSVRPAVLSEYPLLDIVEGSVRLSDASGDNAVGADEPCSIVFDVRNTGKGPGNGCVARVSTVAAGISVADRRLPSIAPGRTVRVEIPVRASAALRDGMADFRIAVDEPNGFGCDPVTLTVATRALETPLLKITDYAVSGTGGKPVTRRQPFDLQLLLQNTRHGMADNVNVRLKLPANVVLVDGDASTSVAQMPGGARKLLKYTLIANNNYAGSSIPVRVEISEKYGRYAESATVTLELDRMTTASRIVIDASEEKPQPEIETARIGGIVAPSDVDVNIPRTSNVNAETLVVIIANEEYQSVPPVEFARNDGEKFRRYCIETLGIPQDNIRFQTDATLNNMRRLALWLKAAAEAFDGDTDVIFYYAGHGIPDEASRSAYLLPVDGYGSDAASGYRLSDLYALLGAMPARSVTLFLDACFSGAQRGGGMLASARGVAIKSEPDAPVGRMVVFAAAQGDQTAYPYREKRHGLFTYYLLKKLQQTSGDVTLSELGEYIDENVRRQSLLSNDKAQTPTVSASPALGEQWRSFRLAK